MGTLCLGLPTQSVMLMQGAAAGRRSWFGKALFWPCACIQERTHWPGCMHGCYNAMKNAFKRQVIGVFKPFFFLLLLFLTIGPFPGFGYQMLLHFNFRDAHLSVSLQINAALLRISSILTVKISQAINLSREVGSANTLLASLFAFPFEPKQWTLEDARCWDAASQVTAVSFHSTSGSS